MNSLWNEYGNVADRQKLKSATNEIADHFLSGASTRWDGFRIRGCATHLRVYPDAAYGTFIDTYYCKHRQCPNCQQSKALQWRSRMHQLLDTTPEALSGKWVYLTLTTRNCHVSDLNETITEMNNAFRRLRNRASWKANVIGGIKFLEVDQGISDYQSAHPHFHCLIQVRPSMHQGNNYVTEEKWAEEWQGCLKAHFIPQVRARRLTGLGDEIRNKILKCVSYPMKPRLHAPHRGWFLAMAEQLKDVYLVQPFGHVRGWFSDLKHQDDCELTRHRNDVRLEQKPTTFQWDSFHGSYQKD